MINTLTHHFRAKEVRIFFRQKSRTHCCAFYFCKTVNDVSVFRNYIIIKPTSGSILAC